MNKPTIVLLEGGEGTGKTTHAEWLRDKHGFKIVKLPTPGSDFESIIFGRHKREYPVTDQHKAIAASLDFIDRMQRELALSHKLVLDRGPLSTFAYQSPDTALQSILYTNADTYVDMISHIIIFDIDPETGLSREKVANNISEAGLEFHKRVNESYRYMSHIIDVVAKCRKAERELGVKPGTLHTIEFISPGDEVSYDELPGEISTEQAMNNELPWLKWASLEGFASVDAKNQSIGTIQNTIANLIGLP